MSVKEQIFYYVKVDLNFFDREEIKLIESMPNGKEYIIFYLKLLLKAANAGGKLIFRDFIPYNAQMLSTITNTGVDTVQVAVDTFVNLGLMQKLSDGALFMYEVENMVGSKTYWAEQKAKKRASLKILDNVQRLSNERPPILELEKEIDKEKVLKVLTAPNTKKSSVQFSQFREKLKSSRTVFYISENLTDVIIIGSKVFVDDTGILQSLDTGRPLEKDDALKVWDYFYKNRVSILANVASK